MVTSPITCAAGSTYASGCTRGRRPGTSRIIEPPSPTSPVRLALVEKGAHALPEIGARVGGSDQVLVLRQRPAGGEPPDGLLSDPERDRRVIGDLLRQRGHPRLDLLRRHDLVHVAGRARFLRGQQA